MLVPETQEEVRRKTAEHEGEGGSNRRSVHVCPENTPSNTKNVKDKAARKITKLFMTHCPALAQELLSNRRTGKHTSIRSELDHIQ